MSHNNPFAQGGWKSPENRTLWDNSSTPPSIFGALPYPSAPPQSDFVIYHFTSFNPTLLNCTVIGPDYQPCYRIVSDSTMPGYTTCKTVAGRNLALIEWTSHPLVEIRDVLIKQEVRSWLRLSSSSSYRVMEIRRIQYTWAPYDKFICLYSSSAQLLARISKSQGTITLELTTRAMQMGLLEATIVATVLLQCGRNID